MSVFWRKLKCLFTGHKWKNDWAILQEDRPVKRVKRTCQVCGNMEFFDEEATGWYRC